MTAILRRAAQRPAWAGTIAAIRPVTARMAELRVELDDRHPWVPGQSVILSFGREPGQILFPTFGLQAEADEFAMIFFVPLANGQPRGLDRARPGARVLVSAPEGDDVLRQGHGPLVLVGAGEGFAPVWAKAVAARLGQPDRPLTVIAAADEARDLFMRPAIGWLRARGVDARLVARQVTALDLFVRPGGPADVLPDLSPGHEVHAAGPAVDIADIEERARRAGAAFSGRAFPAADAEAGCVSAAPGALRQA